MGVIRGGWAEGYQSWKPYYGRKGRSRSKRSSPHISFSTTVSYPHQVYVRTADNLISQSHYKTLHWSQRRMKQGDEVDSVINPVNTQTSIIRATTYRVCPSLSTILSTHPRSSSLTGRSSTPQRACRLLSLLPPKEGGRAKRRDRQSGGKAGPTLWAGRFSGRKSLGTRRIVW